MFAQVPAGTAVGTEVGYAEEHAVFLLNDAELHRKGYDVDEADADVEVSDCHL